VLPTFIHTLNMILNGNLLIITSKSTYSFFYTASTADKSWTCIICTCTIFPHSSPPFLWQISKIAYLVSTVLTGKTPETSLFFPILLVCQICLKTEFFFCWSEDSMTATCSYTWLNIMVQSLSYLIWCTILTMTFLVYLIARLTL